MLGEEVPVFQLDCQYLSSEVELTCKDKKAGRKSEAANHHRWQSGFWNRPVVIGAKLFKIELVVVDIHGGGEKDTDE